MQKSTKRSRNGMSKNGMFPNATKMFNYVAFWGSQRLLGGASGIVQASVGDQGKCRPGPPGDPRGIVEQCGAPFLCSFIGLENLDR